MFYRVRPQAAHWPLAVAALWLLAGAPAHAVLTYTIGGSWPNAAHSAAADAAMQAVVGRYNDFGDFGNYNVYVYYNAGIPTAQASYGGSIGFGGTYPNERVTAHELAHYLGLPSGAWNGLMSGGSWDGALGAAKVRQFDGEQAVLSGDSIHFWPYGLNFDSEGSEINKERQVAVVYAMRGDLGIGPTAHPSLPSRGVSQTADNPVGQSGFNYKGQWADGHFAHAGTSYHTGDYKLRTPASANTFKFYGDSLSVSNSNGASGGLIYNGQSGARVIIDDLRLDGGWVQHQAALDSPFRLEGAVDVRSPSAFRAKQGDIDLYADLSGSDALTIEATDSPAQDARYVRFRSSANTFTGDLINKARFELTAGANFNFAIGASGGSNSISGASAYATRLNGAFDLDLSSATANAGDAWPLVTAANASYGDAFRVSGFTGYDGVWSDGGYSFSQASGVLSVVPGWAIDGGGAWSSPASWSAGVPTTGGEATFGSALTAPNSPATVEVDAAVTVSRLTFDNANRYVLSGGSPITLTGGALLHAKQGEHEIAAPIAGSAGLAKMGPGAVTLSAANTYTGDTNVLSGGLLLAGGGSVSGSANIVVHAGAMLDVSGVSGGLSTAAGQTLAGAGTVLGAVTLGDASVLRVGGAGLPSASSAGGHDKIDDFQDYATGKLNAGATGGVWTGVFDGTANAQVVSDGGERSIEFYGIGGDWRGVRTSLSDSFEGGDYSLADGDSATYFFRVQRRGSQALDGVFGLTDLNAIGTSDPSQELAVTLAFAKGSGSRAPNQLLAHDGVSGGDVVLINNVASGEWVNVWLVVDNQGKTFQVATSTGRDDGVLAPSVFDFGERAAAGAALDAFAGAELLSGSDPTAASLRIDDLYRLADGSLANPLGFAGETLTIAGDLTLDGSTLELDLATVNAHDRLVVAGAVDFGGRLQVQLEEGFSLTAGDSFDLLDFASASGGFDDFDLPTLDAGLRWDLADLAVEGSIAVVTGLAGDFNADGAVDAADYTVWRDAQNQDEDAATLAGNGTGDGVVDNADYLLWRSNFGAVLPASASQAAVPEPFSIAMLIAGLAAACQRRPR